VPAKDDAAARGIVFPVDSEGGRSSTRIGAAIVAAALRPMSAAHAAEALAERHWRRRYPLHFRRLVEDALADGQTALAGARAGLAHAHRSLAWADAEADQGEQAFDQAFARRLADASVGTTPPLHTATLRGAGDAAPAPWTVPWRGELLAGDRLRWKIDDWVARGIIEPGCGAALHRCAVQQDWFDLSDRTLVLLGAASEAGPLAKLSHWRANIIALDIDRSAPWQKIAATIRAGNATLHAPLAAPVAGDSADTWLARAGVDLLADSARVATWLQQFDSALDIAALAYLDGERHVRIALAMDAIQQALCAFRRDTTLAFLATPTDVFAVPEATAQAARDAWRDRATISRVLQRPLRLAMGERLFAPNIDTLIDAGNGRRYGIVDSLVIEQGPNYALAKRLQQWRALTARAAGHRVSMNVAPSTTTASVIKNPALAAGFAGADAFGIEVFEPATTNAIMAALWVHDLRNDQAAASPATALAHPFELLMSQAAHGGLWRSAYLPRSALPFAAALGWVKKRL
jgi:hypothetical protein